MRANRTSSFIRFASVIKIRNMSRGNLCNVCKVGRERFRIDSVADSSEIAVAEHCYDTNVIISSVK